MPTLRAQVEPSAHPDWFAVWPALSRLDDATVGALARLTLDDKVVDAPQARDGAVGPRVDRSQAVHSVELDGAHRPLMDELLEGNLVEWVAGRNGGRGGCPFDGSTGRGGE